MKNFASFAEFVQVNKSTWRDKVGIPSWGSLSKQHLQLSISLELLSHSGYALQKFRKVFVYLTSLLVVLKVDVLINSLS